MDWMYFSQPVGISVRTWVEFG